MPKPPLAKEEDRATERHMIETALAGLKRWRPDLDFPQSYSDMEACVRALMTMFDVRRRPLPEPPQEES